MDSCVNRSRVRGEENETLFLMDTAVENAMAFGDCWRRYDSVDAFLRRDEYIPVRATTLTEGVDQEGLNHESDVDGVTIEWKNLAMGLKSEFRHFELLPMGGRSIRRLFPVIKKHLNLSSFHEDSFRVLKECAGTQLMYDGCWETWLGVIPKYEERTFYDYATQTRAVRMFVNRVRVRFQEELTELLRLNRARETLAKNNLKDAKRMFVLPGHQTAILEAFQNALDNTELNELPNFRTILFSFRFGEKCRTPVLLPVRDFDAVRDISVHIGHTISCDFADLFWSREGLQELASSNCNITTAYSLFECANMQSVLDRSPFGISGDLRTICTYPTNVRFVQMYNDTPHRYPSTRVHPVSGSVLMLEGLLTANAQNNLYSDAITYIGEVENNFIQCIQGVCRLEFVVSLSESGKEIDPSRFIRLDQLAKMLGRHPMIVSFHKTLGTMKHLQEVGLHLVGVLQSAYRTRRGTSDTQTVWDVYQAELAVEKLIWGRPLCSSSNLYSTNLGTGLGYPTRCLTDKNGFLCLEPSTCCCVDEKSLPPLYIFTKNVTIQRQVSNVSGLYGLIGGSQRVLGVRLIQLFLSDCHACGKVFINFEQFVLLLKTQAGNANKRIVGGISVHELSRILTDAPKMKWPYVLGAVKKLLLHMNVNVEKVLEQGIFGLNLGYFPAVRTHDSTGHQGLYWQYHYGYWVLTDINDENIDLERESAVMHLLILSQLETRKLCHSSLYANMLFPWIKDVLEKMKEKKLTKDEKVKVLTFVTCVAFVQGGRYVDYWALNRLERELPLTQTMLRMLEVQCKFRLPGVNNVIIYRLHPSIPFKLDQKRKLTDDSSSKPAEQQSVPDLQEATDAPEQIQQVEDDKEVHNTILPEMKHVASNRCYNKWSPAELALLEEVGGDVRMTNFEKYQAYQRRCRALEIPDRSWAAFNLKMARRRSEVKKT